VSALFLYLVGILLKTTDTPQLLSNYKIFRKKLKMKNMIFGRRVELLCAGMKALSGKSGGKVLLGDNTEGGAALLRPCWSLNFNWTPLYKHM
jgi:hypothetical protein